jgi:membrane protease YdiL (CAAX protease family)
VDPHSLFPLGPLLAAFVVLGATGGWPAVRDFARRMVRGRVAAPWYALVLGLPVAIAVAGLALNPFFGSAPPTFGRMPPLGELLPTFVFILLFIGVGEEPAWRGVALPGLAAGRSMIAAALALAALHALWHLPLFGLEYTRVNGLPWLMSLAAYSVITAWLYTRTDGNLLLPSLFHASVNTSAKFLLLPLFQGADLVRLWWIWAALWAAAAAWPLVALRRVPPPGA